MDERIIDLIKLLGQIVAGALVATGLIGGLWSLWDKWKNRGPRLELFVPQFYTGVDAVSKQVGLSLLVRISNLSQRNAYILAETMAVEVKSGDKWHKTQVAWIPNKEYMETDFTEPEKIIHGVTEVKLLKRFESPVISYDNPLTRYIVVTHAEHSVLRNIDAIRLKLRDCHKKQYIMTVDVKEQKKYDPDYQPNQR